MQFSALHDGALSFQASAAVLDAFLNELDGEKVVMVADPPFGGLVKPLANSFSMISQTWKNLQNSGQQFVCFFRSLFSLLMKEVIFLQKKNLRKDHSVNKDLAHLCLLLIIYALTDTFRRSRG